MELHGIQFPSRDIEQLCRRYDVVRLGVFGSILTPAFGASSDIDLLAEFPTGGGPGLFGFAQLELDLSELLQRRVHLHTPAMLGPGYREQVVRACRLLNAA